MSGRERHRPEGVEDWPGNERTRQQRCLAIAHHCAIAPLYKMSAAIGEDDLWIRIGGILVLVGTVNLRHQMTDNIELSLLLVARRNHVPRRYRVVRAGEHLVARGAVVVPVFDRDLVDRTDLPLLERIDATVLKPALLLLL